MRHDSCHMITIRKSNDLLQYLLLVVQHFIVIIHDYDTALQINNLPITTMKT